LKSTGKKEQKMIIDYGIGYVKSNGSISTKIYKLKSVKLGPKESMLIKKNHSLKKITTTTFYSGKPELIIQVNGKIFKKVYWDFAI